MTRVNSKKNKSEKTKNKSSKIWMHSHNNRKIIRELKGMIFFVLAIFMFITYYYPNTTGYVGTFLLKTISYLFGEKGAYAFPIFLLIPGFSILFTVIKVRTLLLCGSACFISYSILIESLVYQSPMHLSWPLVSQAGGVVGVMGGYFLNKLIGYNGTLVVIFSIFIICSIIVFGISFQRLITSVIYMLKFSEIRIKKDSKNNSNASIFKKVIIALFFNKTKYLSSSRKEKLINLPNKKDDDIVFEPFQLEYKDPIQESESKKSSDMSFELGESLEDDTEETEIEEYEEEVIVDDIVEDIVDDKEVKEKEQKQTLNVSENKVEFKLPAVSLLKEGKPFSIKNRRNQNKVNNQRSTILEEALISFNVAAKVVNVVSGPSITRFELQPGDGVKISKITSLSKDIALKLAAPDIRIEAPIPGKSLIGIEVPNMNVDMVSMGSIIKATDFYEQKAPLLSVIGVTITGDTILMDLSKMPHVLIAGATGSGKSVCINAIIVSILMKSSPEEVKFLMIDPKKVELILYEGIPNLLAPVVTNPHKAAATLKKWALIEMERRYEEFSTVGVKDIIGYNNYVEKKNNEAVKKGKESEESIDLLKKLPRIVVVIDELADLMMVAAQDVESTICRLAQMARATGIHLVIATQRPSVNVVTGLIKANVPSRISFFLQSQIDSRTILDMPGAEKLMGKGDMLYSPVGAFKPKRVQGIFVSEDEVKSVVSFLKKQGGPNYIDEIINVEPIEDTKEKSKEKSNQDALFDEAKELVINAKYASTSYLQRKLRIGYNRAARIMDELESQGVINEHNLNRPTRNTK
ncbi:cell division protein FtsK [Candidatus Marinamargulisbacteria bacterium SCGC AG-410-N11]|nr:cell division protein FtsK [Candidatus Marinamargulisbacteria bacterium SCGC AG-410-N11]